MRIDEKIENGEKWLTTAKIDYKDFRKLIRCSFFPFLQAVPNEPNNTIGLLQQCTEKMVKAIAIESKLFSYEDLEKKYKHNTLKLCIDIIEAIMDSPLICAFMNEIEGQIMLNSDVKIVSIGEAFSMLNNLKQKVYKDSRTQELSDWAYQFATMSPEEMQILLSSLLKQYRVTKISSYVLKSIPLNLLVKNEQDFNKFNNSIMKQFNKRGIVIANRFKGFFEIEEVKKFMDSKPKEKKLELFNHFADFMIVGWLLETLIILSALTFSHGITTRYPTKNNLKSGKIMGSELYTKDLGIVSNLLLLGKLIGLSLKELNFKLKDFHYAFEYLIINDLLIPPNLTEPT